MGNEAWKMSCGLLGRAPAPMFIRIPFILDVDVMRWVIARRQGMAKIHIKAAVVKCLLQYSNQINLIKVLNYGVKFTKFTTVSFSRNNKETRIRTGCTMTRCCTALNSLLNYLTNLILFAELLPTNIKKTNGLQTGACYSCKAFLTLTLAIRSLWATLALGLALCTAHCIHTTYFRINSPC